jgi:hypothetical protein
MINRQIYDQKIMAKTWLQNSEKTHTSQDLIRLKGFKAEHALCAAYFLHFTWIIENNASKYFNCIRGKSMYWRYAILQHVSL